MAYKSAKMELSRLKSVVLYVALVSISLVILFGTITLESISISRSEAAMIDPRNISSVGNANNERTSNAPEPRSPKMKTIKARNKDDIDVPTEETVENIKEINIIKNIANINEQSIDKFDSTDSVNVPEAESIADKLVYVDGEPVVDFVDSSIIDKKDTGSSAPESLNPDDLFRYIEANDIESFCRADPPNLHQIWDAKGFNLLHRAASKANFDFINLIVENSSLMFPGEMTRDGRGLTEAHLVVENSETDFEVIKRCLEKLIDSGFDIDGKAGGDGTEQAAGYTPLYSSAVIKNNQQLVDYILTYDANVNAVYDGYPLLHHAIAHSDIEIVKSLLRAGADVQLANKFNRRALHEAAFLRKKEIVKELLESKTVHPDDRTPPHPAGSRLPAKKKREKLSDPVMYEATAIHYAVRNGDFGTYAVLRDARAKNAIADAYGDKPEYYDNGKILGSLGCN